MVYLLSWLWIITRWSIERTPSPLHRQAECLVPSRVAWTPPRTRKILANQNKLSPDKPQVCAKDVIRSPLQRHFNQSNHSKINQVNLERQLRWRSWKTHLNNSCSVTIASLVCLKIYKSVSSRYFDLLNSMIYDLKRSGATVILRWPCFCCSIPCHHSVDFQCYKCLYDFCFVENRRGK